jgi:hypothetical protein
MGLSYNGFDIKKCIDDHDLDLAPLSKKTIVVTVAEKN